jgi:hypothetical protein
MTIFCPICNEPLIRRRWAVFCVYGHSDARQWLRSRSEIKTFDAAVSKHLGTFRGSTGRPPHRLKIDGEEKTIKELIEENKCVVPARTARGRIERGWPDESVTSIPSLAPGQYYGK